MNRELRTNLVLIAGCLAIYGLALALQSRGWYLRHDLEEQNDWLAALMMMGGLMLGSIILLAVYGGIVDSVPTLRNREGEGRPLINIGTVVVVPLFILNIAMGEIQTTLELRRHGREGVGEVVEIVHEKGKSGGWYAQYLYMAGENPVRGRVRAGDYSAGDRITVRYSVRYPRCNTIIRRHAGARNNYIPRYGPY